MDLERIVECLLGSGLEFVIIGGYAAVVHGAIDVTRDIDICCRFDDDSLARLQGALAPLNPKHRLTLHDAPLDLQPGRNPPWRNLYLRTDAGIVDCLSEVLGVGGFDQVLAGSVSKRTSMGDLRVLDIPTLIQAKLAVGRPHDLRAAVQLRCLLDVPPAAEKSCDP